MWHRAFLSGVKMRSILWRFTKMAVGVYIIGGPPTENQQQDVSLRNALKKEKLYNASARWYNKGAQGIYGA